MNQPATHDRMLAHWPHRWNPYYSAQSDVSMLNDTFFRSMLADTEEECRLNLHLDCLDAPDEIPMGSTQSIRTIGGFCRERYNLQRRGEVDWKVALAAEIETARMVREILQESELQRRDEVL